MVVCFDDVKERARSVVGDLWLEQQRRWPIAAAASSGRVRDAVQPAVTA
jgi:hypothetical protein